MFNLISVPAVAAIVALVQGVHAAPVENRNLKIRGATGDVVPGEYIVKLKDGTNLDNHSSLLPFPFSVEDTDSPILSVFERLFSYVGTFSDAELQALSDSPDVEFMEPNKIYSINEQQTDATWGLQSLSTQSSAPVGDFTAVTDLSYTYNYSDPDGEGVDIYIVDTGIYIAHQEFEGRATFPYAAGGMQTMDGHGHGTHCAGTAAGKTFGVAKKASLIGVKVLSDNGNGKTSDIIDGVNWVITNAATTGRPSIASMSLGGDASDALDAAVNSAIAAGITVVVAAGNSNADATQQSPARVAAAITVGAANITNTKATFSNFGAPVDIWAPGVNIVSAWPFTNDTATKVLSGTSQATPHITGLAAYFLSKDTSLKPDTLAAKIVGLGQQNVLGGVPDGTVNLLAYNGGVDSAQVAPSSSTSSTFDLPTPTDSDNSTPSSSDTSVPSSTDGAQESKLSCPTWWPTCFWGH